MSGSINHSDSNEVNLISSVISTSWASCAQWTSFPYRDQTPRHPRRHLRAALHTRRIPPRLTVQMGLMASGRRYLPRSPSARTPRPVRLGCTRITLRLREPLALRKRLLPWPAPRSSRSTASPGKGERAFYLRSPILL
jgi:hypothetical protein